uniref:Uncharacterized protein n=1 Tax=Nelumbo nucifera TaxID=4432 RepID=A0A822ZZM7_NELNU|nr:TPA_asm: hypothetical protein HUJ06_017335 [Nelumbo nucifera]
MNFIVNEVRAIVFGFYKQVFLFKPKVEDVVIALGHPPPMSKFGLTVHLRFLMLAMPKVNPHKDTDPLQFLVIILTIKIVHRRVKQST